MHTSTHVTHTHIHTPCKECTMHICDEWKMQRIVTCAITMYTLARTHQTRGKINANRAIAVRYWSKRISMHFSCPYIFFSCAAFEGMGLFIAMLDDLTKFNTQTTFIQYTCFTKPNETQIEINCLLYEYGEV